MQNQNVENFETALRSLPLAREALGAYPLSNEQKRLWLLAQLTDADTLPVTTRHQFTGTFDIARIQQNLGALITRSETLRSLFVEVMDQPVRLLMPTGQVKLEYFDQPPSGNDLAERINAPFELGLGPLLRVFISRIATQHYELHLAGHPIVVDEYSLQQIAASLFHLETHNPQPATDALAAVFQRETMQQYDEQCKIQWQQWGTLLQAPAATEIPSENPRPPVKGTRRKVHELQCPYAGPMPNETSLAASWLTVLMRWQGSQAALCGVKTRDNTLRTLLGPLQTYLPIRADMCDNSTLADVEQQVARQFNDDRPAFATLLAICPPKRDLSRAPYFQTGIEYLADSASSLPADSGKLERLPTQHPSSDLDLFITCRFSEGNLALTLDYDCDILGHRQIDTLAQALAAVMAAPRRSLLATVPLLDASLREQILLQSHGERTIPESGTLTDRVAASAAQTPAAIAVIDHHQQFTYHELWRRAECVAANIRQHSAETGRIIALALPRSADFIAALLGILRSGNVFLPIDPRLPADRIRFLLENSGCELVIASHTQNVAGWPDISRLWLEELDPNAAWTPPTGRTDRDAAYVIYTSGSTGVPKGVMVEHRQVVNNLAWRQRTWPLSVEDNVLHNHSFSFDPSIWAVFWPLLNGATIVLADIDAMEDSNVLLNLMIRHSISVLGGVPSMLGALIDHPSSHCCQTVKLVLSGGEVLSNELARKIRQTWKAEVANLYGPTEATIDALCFRVPATGNTAIPIGYPLDNTTAYIVDPDLNLLPHGVPGEIMLAGRNLARGYLGKPGETAQRFLPNPYASGRWYATGDLGRRDSTGAIVYLGRRDHQVKIRGHRIELNEVAHQLSQILDLNEVIVFALHAGTEQARLVAAIERQPNDNHTDIAQTLQRHLPAYLIPGQFLHLDTLPRTATGKVDMDALRKLATPTRDTAVATEHRAPRSELEKSLMHDFAQVLNLTDIAPDTDFFAQGGTSILLTRLAGKLSAQYQVQIPLHEFFRIPTPAAVAEVIEMYRREGLTALLAHQHAQTLEQDIYLDAQIQAGDLPHANWYQPSVVFLTGATGYLGLYLIEQLLKRTRSRVICLCRAKDVAHAKRRIEDGLRMYHINLGDQLQRVEYLTGDLALPQFGLSDRQWETLAAEVDVIYHNGALVNFVYPYSALKATNVGGTQTILQLACTTRLKSVQYVSTVDTLLATHTPRPFIEDDAPLRSAIGVPAGYTGSKWVAEGVADLGRSRGIPVTIFRPGLILGHTETGASQSIDYLLVALRGFLPMGIVPDYPRIFDIVPVDYVAAAIVHISLQPQSRDKFFHLFNPDPVTIRQFCDWIQEFGYTFRLVDFEEGRQKALSVPPGHPLYPLVPLIRDADPQPHRALDPDFMHEVNPELEGRQTFELLACSDIPRPQTSKAYAHLILRYLIGTGFLTEPTTAPSIYETQD
ncbi:amino acid adenylation domain-containing protein [Serratia rubidaea]|uniref:amino acid adenylation domain-containing protein n=1 Tax=Serratia rubidaea TaxID=61652 RepID=UPI0022B85A24|nr:amino acid adenylation domain-containing protein [Serratia rubidaea]WBF45733.1 amino acid adenylation domain-containing protein [Serratia rubidaea]